MAAKELRVAADKEAITQLEINLIAGLKLDLRPEPSIGINVFSIITSTSDKLVSQYQEGLLDIKVRLYRPNRGWRICFDLIMAC